MKNRLVLLVTGITLGALVLAGISCTGESDRQSANANSPMIVTVDDIARHPERYTDFVGVSGSVEDVYEGYFTMGCEDLCVVVPVEYAGEMPKAGSDIVVYGQVKSVEGEKYVFHGQEIAVQ